MEKILEPFNFNLSQLQDIVTLLKHIEKNNISIRSFMSFIEKKRKERLGYIEKGKKKQIEINKYKNRIALKCPECTTGMHLYPVNTQPGNQTGDDSKSIWICPNKECQETIYSNLTVQKILNQLRSKL